VRIRDFLTLWLSVALALWPPVKRTKQ